MFTISKKARTVETIAKTGFRKNYFLCMIGADMAGIQGMLHENYVFLELRRRV